MELAHLGENEHDRMAAALRRAGFIERVVLVCGPGRLRSPPARTVMS